MNSWSNCEFECFPNSDGLLISSENSFTPYIHFLLLRESITLCASVLERNWKSFLDSSARNVVESSPWWLIHVYLSIYKKENVQHQARVWWVALYFWFGQQSLSFWRDHFSSLYMVRPLRLKLVFYVVMEIGLNMGKTLWNTGAGGSE